MNTFKKIYCDFDGTVSKKDSVNEFLRLFADEKWLEIEERWARGEISSQVCLKKQTALLPQMDEAMLENYIRNIELSEGFIEFYEQMKQKGVEIVILSDGYDMFIKKTLQNHGLDVKYFANTLTYKDGKFDVEFYNTNPACSRNSGTCKCAQVGEKDFCYVGDGVSDFCIAKKAKKVFAKSSLKKYCDEAGVKYIEFADFRDILDAFRKGEKQNAAN